MTNFRLYSSFISRGTHLNKIKLNKANLATQPNIEESKSFVDGESRSTVDRNEVDFHSKIGVEWWNKFGIMRPLHSMNELRVPFVREGLLETNPHLHAQINTPIPLKGTKILDVGCGGGILSEPLARLGAEVTGLDASPELILIGQDRAKRNGPTNLQYVNSSIEEFCKEHQDEFDGVVASEVIEHVTDKTLFLESCLKSLKPGGSVFITTINKTNVSWFAGIVLAEHLLKIVPSGTHEWEKFISPEDITRILEKCNCKTKLVHGLIYNVLTNRWIWTSNTSVNYAIQSVKKVHHE